MNILFNVCKKLKLNSFDYEDKRILKIKDLFHNLDNKDFHTIVETKEFQQANAFLSELPRFIKENNIENILLFLTYTNILNCTIDDTSHLGMKEKMVNFNFNGFLEIFTIFKKQLKLELEQIKNVKQYLTTDEKEALNMILTSTVIDIFHIYSPHNGEELLTFKSDEYKEQLLNLKSYFYNDLKYIKASIV